MSIRDLEEYGKSSPQAVKIAELIIAEFGGDKKKANKEWVGAVGEFLWTTDYWGDRTRAELAASKLILTLGYTEDELKSLGIDLKKRR